MQGLKALMSMDRILAWNVRGLNRVVKKHNVMKFISTHVNTLFGPHGD